MPRSLICSPSHMMNAVPVVSEIMVMRRKPQPGSRTTSPYCVEPLRPSKYMREARALHDADHDRAVARVLVDLALAGLALFAQLLERLDDHGHELEDDARRDVRHDAEREDRELLERTAREHVEHAQERRALIGHDRLHHVAIDARRRDEDADAVDREHPHREEDAAPQLRNLADVGEDAQREPPFVTATAASSSCAMPGLHSRAVASLGLRADPYCGRGMSSTRAAGLFDLLLAPPR